MRETVSVLIAFLVGSWPTAYVWTRLRTGKDIRTLGSGNAGATNVFRCVGRADGALVLLVDALKGMAAVGIGGWWIAAAQPADPRLWGFGFGCAAILGHVFSPWLKFRGGKGVATGAGVALALYPLPFACALLVWTALLAGSRFMSLASIVAAWVFAAAVALFVPEKIHAFIAFAAALFITWTHRSNIARLRQGTESKLFHK